MITRNKTPSKYVLYGLHLTFQIYLLDKPQKDYLNCSNEITFPSGTGFRNIILERDPQKEKGFQGT